MPRTKSPSQARKARFSFVNEQPAAEPETAYRHFMAKLSVETDPADVHLDLERSPDKIQVLDVRSEKAYKACRVPGSINLPWRSIDEASTSQLDRNRTLVTYCWGPGCNAADKAAGRLAGLGFHVKVMIGGLEYWSREGHTVEGAEGDAASLAG